MLGVESIKSEIRAVSPVVSTLILLAVIMLGVSLTLTLINNNLTRRNAEIDFNAAKAFMRQVGLYVDSVAWTAGQTLTVENTAIDYRQYTVNVVETLEYNIIIDDVPTASYTVGVLLFNIPLSKYHLEDGYYEGVLGTNTIVTEGARATAARVIAVQKNPIQGEEDYIRLVVAPVIRLISYDSFDNATRHSKLYLADLILGETPRSSKSMTLTGRGVESTVMSDVQKIEVTVSFPEGDYDETFFHFSGTSWEKTIEGYEHTSLELYTGTVEIDLGI